MRTKVPLILEAGRVRRGFMASDPSFGMCGKFYVRGPCGATLQIVASDASEPEAEGWEHVSISTETGNRCPNWPEMSFVKSLFWEDEECVVEFHPPKSEYVNNHPTCLHLWRPVDNHIRRPNSAFVGMKDRGEMTNDERLAIRHRSIPRKRRSASAACLVLGVSRALDVVEEQPQAREPDGREQHHAITPMFATNAGAAVTPSALQNDALPSLGVTSA